MTTPRRSLLAATALATLLPLAARAQTPSPLAELIVEKKVFEFRDYRTRGGAALANGRVGPQTAGTLNAAGDNAVLISHFSPATAMPSAAMPPARRRATGTASSAPASRSTPIAFSSCRPTRWPT